MWVPRARDDDGKTPFMDKYWLVPNEEQLGKVDSDSVRYLTIIGGQRWIVPH